MGKFYLGLDIGTESVGIACTDENYNLLRAKGADLWAVRLFDAATSAVNRRTKRTARRRLMRRRWRIKLLQELFADHISDEKFFIRLNNSGYYATLEGVRYSLFADKNFSDIDFHKKFPTIYHLRKALIEGKEKYDLRLYYLALHHIIKYRGHFLFENKSMKEIQDIDNLFNELNACIEDILPDETPFSHDFAKTFDTISKIKNKTPSDKRKILFQEISGITDGQKEMISFMLGLNGNLTKLFGEKYKDIKNFSFSDKADEEFFAMQTDFGDDFIILEKLKAINDYVLFADILNGKEYISDSMVEIYEKHKSDLYMLKGFVKNNFDENTYHKIFRSTKETNNYANYIGYNIAKSKKIKVKSFTDVNDLYKFLKGVLNKDVKDEETKKKIFEEMEKKTFLPKILRADNGLFPHQINGVELNKILENLKKDYPAFAICGEYGSIADKIKAIFEFKIPYYVGPLNSYHSNSGGNSWLVRKEEGKILPWNFNDKVDLAASNENFMRRMTNKCSYLHAEDVLPKSSILYQKFNTLNQLNKLTVDGRAISVELKQKIFNELYLNKKRVSERDIKRFLVSCGALTKDEEKTAVLGGTNGTFDFSMSSYVIFKNMLGDLSVVPEKALEDIILWHTLNTDKTVVENLILKNYGDISVIKEKIKEIKGLSGFKDFGRLSQKFLCGIYGGADSVTGEVYTIIGELYNTNKNLNEIIFDNVYDFENAIKAENEEGDTTVTYKDLEDLYVSPEVRRGIWQALQMVDEYVNAVGKAPDKIFIEVTRNDEKEKKVKESRKSRLLALYKDVKGIGELTAELNRKTESDLRSERLYLYFNQLGRCAYSGEVIKLEELSSNLYDVDHIIPRSLKKDDSLDNKVLVKRTKNAEKTDIYPLPDGFITTQARDLLEVLRAKKLISDEKYKRIIRTAPLTADDYNGFISKQLVVTNQTVKCVAELLAKKFANEKTKIVYSKASNVNDFKNDNDLIKCRETNDLHHARDAYLNIVVGNVYDTRFSNYKEYAYKKDEEYRRYNLKYLFRKDIEGAWNTETSLNIAKHTFAKTSMIVTRYSYISKGKFYDETVYGKNETCAVGRKENGPLSDTAKYGGYDSLSTAYFAIVKSLDKNGKDMKTIEAVPVLIDYKAKGDREKLKEYFASNGLKSPQIIVPKLKTKSLISVNGFRVWISGKTGNQILLHNAVEWFTDKETDEYINALTKLTSRDNDGFLDDVEKNNDVFIIKTNRFKENKLSITKESNVALFDKIVSQIAKENYSGISTTHSYLNTLNRRRNYFIELSTLDQAKTILQIIKFLKCNAENANLKLLDEGATCGKILISKNITNVDFRIIDQSPCGLKEKVRKI